MFYLFLAIIFALMGIGVIASSNSAFGAIIGTLVFFSLAFWMFRKFANKSQKQREEEELALQQKNLQNKLKKKINESTNNSGFGGIIAKNIGGSGYPLQHNQEISFGAINTALIIAISSAANASVIEIPFEEIHLLEISGPGTVVSDAGVSGGGFGLEGFIQGAVAAAIINAATTKSSTNTFMRILTTKGEIYLHTAEIDPADLKVKLSPVFVYLANKSSQKANNTQSITQELQSLQKLFEDGILSQDEFTAAKKKILS